MDVYCICRSTVDFNALDSSCQRIAVVANEKYSNHLIYDKQRGMIVPDSSDDELYAGSYSPRGYPEKSISIEMLWYYYGDAEAVSDSDKRMTIVTEMFENISNAESNLKKVRPGERDAYVKRVERYMGCIHQVKRTAAWVLNC